MRKSLSIVFILILLFTTSCVHHSPFVNEYYFQSMGSDNEIVITADIEKLKTLETINLPKTGNVDEIIKRSDRFSVAFNPKTTQKYPLEIKDYDYYGAFEGNFGKGLINTALNVATNLKKVSEDGVKYYTNGEISVASPINGIVLFSTSSYTDTLKETILEREKKISDEISQKMASSTIAVFVNRPETLLDLGFEMPQTTLKQIKECVLLLDETDGILSLSGDLIMWDESGARTMNTLLKNQLIQSIKKSGEKLDVKAISHLFNYKENIVIIDRFPLSGEALKKAQDLLSALSL